MKHEKQSHLHFMGIGGQGISAVAQMAQLAGHTVTGCDRQPSATTRALERVGIPIQIGHSAHHLDQVDILVISPAVPALDPYNPELQGGQDRAIPVLTWQELLGTLMQGKCVLSISGVHGKGTTTAMLSLLLVDAGLDPTCEIGAVVPRFGANYRLGKSQYFVNEADEYNHNFWHYHPRVAVVTSIEFEHPEFFADYSAFLAAFEHFIRQMDIQGDWPVPPTLILNAASPGCLDLYERLKDWPGQILTFNADARSVFAQPSAFEAYDISLEGETNFRVRTRIGGEFPSDHVVRLQLPGKHNVENALAAIAVAHLIGVDADTIVKTLGDFNGTRRRFEIRQQGAMQLSGRQVADVILVDDYAHHPSAIASTLEATRQRYPERRIVAVYQPHMYSRTKTFFTQFTSAFDRADVTVISDIFPARERDTGLVHSRDLAIAIEQQTHSGQVLYGGSVQMTVEALREVLRSGDIVLIMGAGDIYTVTEALMQETALPGRKTE